MAYIGDVRDYSNKCIRPLQDADTNSDNFLSKSEYISYVQLFSFPPHFDVDVFERLFLTFAVDYKETICSESCMHNGIVQNDCLQSCFNGIPLKTRETYDEWKLKEFLYLFCVVTFDEINILSFADNGSNRYTSASEVTIELSFNMANLKNMTAIDFAEDSDREDGFLNLSLLPALEGLREKVQRELVRENVLLEMKHPVKLNHVDSFINMIIDDLCPEYVLKRYPNAKCQEWRGIIKMRNIKFYLPLENLLQLAKDMALNYIANGELFSNIPREIKGDYIVYLKFNGSPHNSAQMKLLIGITTTTALLLVISCGTDKKKKIYVFNKHWKSLQPYKIYFRLRDEKRLINTGALAKIETHLLSRLTKTGNESSHVQGDFEQSNCTTVGNHEGKISSDFGSEDSDDSDVGSSGWSSSAGMSSIETGVSDELRTYLLSRLTKTGNENSHVQGDFEQSNCTTVGNHEGKISSDFGSEDSDDSDVGSSGWSSSAGMSSIETGVSDELRTYFHI